MSNYWAKGTGFGTGSTASNWNIERAMSEKIKEEEELVIIFQVRDENVFACFT